MDFYYPSPPKGCNHSDATFKPASSVMLRTLHTTICVQALLLGQLGFAKGDQQVLGPQGRLRNASLADADNIATIVIAAFEPLPSWQYLYYFRHSFPQAHRECVRFGITQMLSHPDSKTEVIEAPHGSKIPLVAVAAWRQSHFAHGPVLRNAPEGCFKSMNITRAIDWERKFNAAEREFVQDVFGKQQVYLFELATHPDYQSKGAGTRLVEIGVERGRREGVNVTLIAQPTAEGFYLKRGFKEIRNISIESVDRNEEFEFNVMAYDLDTNLLE
ncbi:uncharacterized protein EKO05_0011432 [Ascochyta rabiei]|uniref:Uncharacterized protein n=1 Tax=Didymella rabiei TaxID=5454 RepID=A0A163K9B2_DIDRA|nr:uncharacterized protein EKO05_0011432 [Ascochyta rabiei]KZM26858.1 hypothetical protein ST47_g1948 [Ascochyta rabiei]UPX21239.1 hypothetical protein EKO05_0011432 [Ascochyta rabiei]